MLSSTSFAWIAALALITLFGLATLVLGILLQRVVGVAVSRYVAGRQHRLLPLVLKTLSDPQGFAELRGALRPFDDGLVLEMLMRLAIDVREEDGTDIVRLCGRLGLLEREIHGLSSLRSVRRRRAAANLGLLRQAAAIPTLLVLLEDRNTNVRLAAIDALADIRCHKGLVELIPWIGDEEPAVSWRIQEALSRGGCDVGPQLIRFLARSEDPHGQAAAIRVLRWVSPEKAVDRLCSLAQSPSPILRREVARGLASIGTERCAAALHALLADPSPAVRVAAVQGLGATGRKSAVGGLRAALDDESRSVRSQAARSLVDLGDAGIDALVRAPVGGRARKRATLLHEAAELAAGRRSA